MNQTIEATGRTLDEAKRAAAESLGISVDECDFQVLEEASKGLFAKTNYRVKATVKPPEPTPVKEKAVRKPRAAVAAQPAEAPESDGGAEETPRATEEDAKTALETLKELVHTAGLDVKVKLDGVNSRYVNLSLTGKDVERLTANRGQTLDSMQYLMNAMLRRSLKGSARVTLDAGDYRTARTAALEKLAKEVASAVLEREQEAVLDALPAHERRVIHNALKDYAGIATYSEGEEPARRVVVSPKKD
jgi:spoIIIJ-associated protein